MIPRGIRLGRDPMQKLLTTTLGCATWLLCACSIPKEEQEITYRTSILEELPFVYKLTVQQGNVLTQDLVNKIQPGMSKRQVRYALGTPLLIDVFHDNRWDYIAQQTRGRQILEHKHIALFFENDQLVRIEGDLKPDPGANAPMPGRETITSVPDYQSDEGTFAKTLRAVGIEPAED